MKYFLEWKGYGKFKYPVPKLATKKELKELIKEGIKIFNNKADALAYATRLKKES